MAQDHSELGLASTRRMLDAHASRKLLAEVAEVNAWPTSNGKAHKKCLRCDREFLSKGKQNRICWDCAGVEGLFIPKEGICSEILAAKGEPPDGDDDRDEAEN